MEGFVIYIDTREQKFEHITERLDKLGVKWKKKKLDFGDYSFEYHGKSFENIVVIERKMSLDELAGNFTVGRERFTKEFERAVEKNAKVHLFVEDMNGINKLRIRQKEELYKKSGVPFIPQKTYRSKMTAKSFIGSIQAFKERYNLNLVFCRKMDTAKKMIEIFQEVIDGESLDKEV